MKKILKGLVITTIITSRIYAAEEGAMDDETFAIWLAQNQAQQEKDHEANLAKIAEEERLKRDAEARVAQEREAEAAEEAEFQRALAESLLMHEEASAVEQARLNREREADERALEDKRIQAISADIMRRGAEEEARLKKIAEEEAARELAANTLDDEGVSEWIRLNEAQMAQEHEANLAKIAMEEERLRKVAEEAAIEQARLQKIAQEKAADKRRLPELSNNDMEATFGASSQHSQWFHDNIGNFHSQGDQWSDEKLQFLFTDGIFQHYFYQFTKFDFENYKEVEDASMTKPYFDFLVFHQVNRKDDPNKMVYNWYKTLGNALKEQPILKKLGGAFQLLKVQLEKIKSKIDLLMELSENINTEISDSNKKEIIEQKNEILKKLFYLDKNITKEQSILVAHFFGKSFSIFSDNDTLQKEAKAKNLMAPYTILDNNAIKGQIELLVKEQIALDRKAIDCQTLLFHWIKNICDEANAAIFNAKKTKYENIDALIPALVNKNYDFLSYGVYQNIIDIYGTSDHYPR